MFLSSQLRLKMKAEREAALALEKATKAVLKEGEEARKEMNNGFERASWYSSCLFEKHKDICSELNTENKRFFLSLYEVQKRSDVIYDMVKLFIENETKHINNNKIREIDRKIANIISSYQAGTVTKLALVNAISITISKSLKFNNTVLSTINRSSLIIVTGVGLYGKIQKAALSARKLRMTNPDFYWDLHKNKIEMLYFLIEDRLNESLRASAGRVGEDKLITIIKVLAQ